MQSEDRESGKGHWGRERHRQVSPESPAAPFPPSLLTMNLTFVICSPLSPLEGAQFVLLPTQALGLALSGLPNA